MAEYNGETKVILHRLDQLSKQVGRQEEKLDKFAEVTMERLKQCEIQSALLEKANIEVCDDIKVLQVKSDRNDVISGIAGAITGAGTAIAAVWAAMKGG